ncbi:hypothetical protein BD311DRAFT_667689 [Dichomitus squalens]|uniref:Xylosidase/arabinosidase n=1 Tax=Dichomitus squalens TaxID=114155 RepID=A0A4Q9MG82_9APHY|nr:hypothetical protein BD311DRAFT_667689 [Dichomitus squalens]
MASLTKGRTLKRADPSTIHDKFLVGYQGWFTCAGDGEPVGPGHHGWLHWFDYPIPDGGRPNTDLWPDTSEYTPSELFPAPGLRYPNGEQAFLFSSRHPKTVQRHFNWMALHGVDGAFLQRFLGQCDVEQGNEGIRRQRDEVGDRVMEAAEKEGRVFAIMYDVSGVAPDRIQRVLEQDWVHLIRRKGVLDSPAYLREQGRPVVALWGFGMSDAHHSPETVRAVTRFIRDNTPGGAYIMAGVPAHWRTSVADADPNPEFVRVYMEEFDAISPWTIGRYNDEESADQFEQEKIKGDVEFIKEHNDRWEANRTTMRRIDYIPVVHPGGSGYNLSEGKWKWNDAPRKGGHYLWRQVYNVRRHNVRTIYGAMWDEYDEGTAFMPVVSHKRQVPVHDKYRFMALDEDGFDLPPDWYMRICGFAAEGLRGERLILDTFPSKELQDYWSSRPRYEEEASSSQAVASGSGSGSDNKEEKGQAWEDWEKEVQAKEVSDEPPPPPYSLEVEEPQAQSAPINDPPAVPLGRRPTVQSQVPPPAPASTRPVPPAVNSGSRPQSLSRPSRHPQTSSHPSSPQSSPHLVPTDEFSRLAISSSIPPSPHEQPSFNPHLFPTPIAPSPPSGGPPGPWSQAPWPPPEWNSPQGPAAIPVIGQFFQDSSPSQSPPFQGPGYSPSYTSSAHHTSTAPSTYVRPRPSVSHHTRPMPPPTRPHGPGSPRDQVGGFAFPEAHVSPAPSGNYYEGPTSHSSYPSSPYSAVSQAPSFPGEAAYSPPAGPPPNHPPRKSDFYHVSSRVSSPVSLAGSVAITYAIIGKTKDPYAWACAKLIVSSFVPCGNRRALARPCTIAPCPYLGQGLSLSPNRV